ncbi:chromaffin granule amine transporter [Caerostris darwini]|uniref:Chromaffin granule amine transporter n=1 Tax=Caerostris darwini TaxID=1538125 RepID=A0AAV4PIF8_9ARAC|nr:chromaffin granule amine transporter [Caerostris darwini]
MDASLMPLLANVVDIRYVAIYGTVYAIAETAVCLSYSIGPLFGGYLVKEIGFSWVMWCVGILNLLYCPLCYFLKDIPVREEEIKGINLEGPTYYSMATYPEIDGHQVYARFVDTD